MNPLNVAVFCVVYGALFYHVTAQSTRRCPSNMIQLMNGIACSTDAMCQGMATGFFCYQGYCCSNSNQVQSGYGSSCTFDSQCIYPNMHCSSNVCYCLPGYDYDGSTCSLQSGGGGTCGTNQVSINGQCYQTAQPGGTCQFNSQCIDLHALRPMYCANGICQWVNNGNPTCKTPSAVTERINGVIKNCLYQDCSTGYRCEYNANFNNGQYICCSTGGTGNGANPIGQPKFYLGSQMPLQCRAVNACTFVDYPNCVYSQRYGYQVCCSTRYCQ
uniref:CC domain-containing protein n=1 Tax=Panagrellus redivivus TaxID=6233 RepID=A0A7E4VNQ3_PANRE